MRYVAWVLLVVGVAGAVVVSARLATAGPPEVPFVAVPAYDREPIEFDRRGPGNGALVQAVRRDPGAFLAAVARRRIRQCAAAMGPGTVSVEFDNEGDHLRIDTADAMMAKYGWEKSAAIVLRVVEE